MNVHFDHYPNSDYPWHWYYSPQGVEFPGVYDYLYTTFGEPGRGYRFGRWDSQGGWIMFRHESDAMLFTLRFS